VGLSFCVKGGEAFYLPVAHHYLGVPEQVSWAQAREVLKEVLEDETISEGGAEYQVRCLRVETAWCDPVGHFI
jgi:DNA polymerase-1